MTDDAVSGLARVSIGVAGALGPDAIAQVARAAEEAGFRGLWVNDTPGGDALEGLAAAAAVTERIVLATGVIPLDRRSAAEIVADVERWGLPPERLVLGVGSGGARTGALALVGEGVRWLRERTAARILVGALGPRMRQLAAGGADGLLLSWLTPAVAAAHATEARAIAADTHVALYARTSVDDEGRVRRDAEADRYGTYPAYAANFSRLGIGPRETVLPLPGASLAVGAARYLAAVDELVLRAIPARDEPAAYGEFVRAAARALTEAD